MSQILVDSHTLLDVRDKLGQLHDQLTSMHTVIWSYWGELGGRALEGELEHFCGTWHYGVTEVDHEITDLMGRLTQAAAAYKRIDQRIADASHGHGGGSRSHGGSGTTVIDPGGSRHAGTGQGAAQGGSHGGSGSGTTVIGSPRHPTGGAAVGGTSSNHQGGAGKPPHSVSAPIHVSSPLLTGGQETFVGKLSMLTGLSPRVVGAWALAEESSDAAQERESEDNNDWLNIGYFDSGPGAIASDHAFDNPDTAAEKTAEFLQGSWGGASSSIRGILGSAGKSPDQQIDAIADSDWASSHYDGGNELRATYRELADMSVRG